MGDIREILTFYPEKFFVGERPEVI